MPITSDQRTTIGQMFLAEIDRRIELREKAKKSLVNSTMPERLAAIEKDLETLIPGHTLGKVIAVGGYSDTDVTLGGGIQLHNLPFRRVPAYHALKVQDDKNDKKRQELCQELEFLHRMKGGSRVGAFQSYITRLWSPSSKDETLSRSLFNTHFEAFADSLRGFTCNL